MSKQLTNTSSLEEARAFAAQCLVEIELHYRLVQQPPENRPRWTLEQKKEERFADRAMLELLQWELGVISNETH